MPIYWEYSWFVRVHDLCVRFVICMCVDNLYVFMMCVFMIWVLCRRFRCIFTNWVLCQWFVCVCVFMIGVTPWLVRVCGVRLCRRMQQHRVFIRVIRQSMGSSFLAIILILKFRDNVAYWCQIPKREYNRNRAAPWNGSLESLDVSHARETDLIDPILALWDVSHDMFSADV